MFEVGGWIVFGAEMMGIFNANNGYLLVNIQKTMENHHFNG